MDRALYIAASGAAETLRQQAVNTNNIANASTTGFRAELLSSQAVAVQGPGLPTRVNAVAADLGWDASGGAIEQTGRDLDVAMRPEAWLAVQASDGSEAYTKAGNLQVDASGQLRTASGQLVLGDGGPISLPPSSQISIGGDGTVTVQPQGQSAATLSAVGRLKLVSAKPEQLQRGRDGLMRSKPGITLDPASGQALTSGALEASNVNLPQALVQMISLARQFEAQTKMMKATEDNAAAAATIARLSG